MAYLGDFALGSTFDCKFTTVRQDTGVAATLAGSPVVKAFVDNNTTGITAGITLTVDFSSITGLNNIRVVASGGNGYAAGSNYALVITTGTVNGLSAVGFEVHHFSIAARSVAAINGVSTSSVTAVNANLGTAQPINATGTGGSALVKADAVDIGGAASVGAAGYVGVDWGQVTNKNTSNNLSGTLISTSQVVASVTAAVTITAASVQAIWDALTSALTTVGSIGKLLVDNINATISSRLASASITLTGGAVTVGTNNDKTGYTLSSAGNNAAADALLVRDWTAVAAPAARSVFNALRFLRNKWTITGGTLTVTKEDDSTSAWTGAVTTTAGNPVSQIDPT